MPPFPDPLTKEVLDHLMQDKRYVNAGHPEHDAYVKWIRRGFEKLYGNQSVKYDATGRMIQPKPIGSTE